MTIKALLYVIMIPIVIYSFDSIDYEKIIKTKTNKIIQARILFFLLVLSVSYLSVNFFYDFFLNSQIIK